MLKKAVTPGSFLKNYLFTLLIVFLPPHIKLITHIILHDTPVYCNNFQLNTIPSLLSML